MMLEIVAAAYAETADFDNAMAAQREAIELAPEAQKADLKKRLELYQSNKPFRREAPLPSKNGAVKKPANQGASKASDPRTPFWTIPASDDFKLKLTINGDVVNHGTFRVTSGTGFEFNGSFTNTGLLDLLTAEVSPTVLQNIVNQGVILDSSMVQVATASRTNGFTVTIQGFAGHSYRLQRSATLIQPDWADIGTAQPGNGAILTFTDPTAAGSALFYRIAVLP